MDMALSPVPSAPVEVGVRELRDNLSRYLDLVIGGVEVVVTNHGRAVARLGPPGGEGKLDQLVAAGVATRPRSNARHVPRPIKARGTASDLVADQRR